MRTWKIGLLVGLAAAFGCQPAAGTAPSTTPPAPAATPPPAPSAEYGLTSETAVEVCKPNGERAYLRRLRCADGAPPQFDRRGSGGSRTAPKTKADEEKMLDQMFREGPLAPGESDFHVIDYYDVRCGEQETTVIMDMYHCHQDPPAQAPPGFTIVPPQ